MLSLILLMARIDRDMGGFYTAQKLGLKIRAAMPVGSPDKRAWADTALVPPARHSLVGTYDEERRCFLGWLDRGAGGVHSWPHVPKNDLLVNMVNRSTRALALTQDQRLGDTASLDRPAEASTEYPTTSPNHSYNYERIPQDGDSPVFSYHKQYENETSATIFSTLHSAVKLFSKYSHIKR
jgi:hypothetical protein